MTQLQWSRSHGEISLPTADPPTDPISGCQVGAEQRDQSMGASADLCPAELRATAWDVLSGQGMSLSDLREFAEEVDENAALRAAALLRALDRLRDELDRIPETADLSDPVTLRVQDAVLLARQLLSRLR